MDYRMPLYIQLQDIIIKKIEEKKYLPGEAIPSERKMAETYGVNRMTVKSAINKLVEQGYLIRKLGAGTYVAQRDYKKIDLSYMDEITGGKGITFATGTQVSNSMTELYTIQRYLQYDRLQEMELGMFDNWASAFGETVTALELSPEGSGYRMKTRFANFFNLPELMSVFS